MSSLQLNLLGSLGALLNGQQLENPGVKSQALLIYLAVERDRPHRRETLFTLLWPGMPEKSARHNLNQAVYALRQGFNNFEDNLGNPIPLLLSNRSTLQLNLATDVTADIHQVDDLLSSIQTHMHPDLAACPTCFTALESALALYRGDFLADFYLEDSGEFEEWAEAVRENYRSKMVEALATLADIITQNGDYERAITYIDRQLTFDDLRENVIRQKIKVLSMAGRRVEAMRQYREFEQHLEQHLGTVPSQETTALYDRILNEDLAASISKPETSTPRPNVPRHNLVPQPTPFIGRKEELAQLDKMLKDPDIRLITIVGPGGIGKTRLAIACGKGTLAQSTQEFFDGVFFIPFAQVNEADRIVFTIAKAINLQLEDSGTAPHSPKEQLLNFLKGRKMLFIADNFEHLLEQTDVLIDILRFAPSVKILVTSRERLYLQIEHLLPLGGLVEINSETPKLPHSHPAVQLFIHSARRLKPDFSLSEEAHFDSVSHICQLVDGVPLALELAAKWINVLTLTEIITEIENNLDFLATDLRDLPERQRSMRAVFNATWRQLSAKEQDVFARFSVFRGGCTRVAAQEVTGASIQILARLSDQALIQYQIDKGRYQIHELMRQFAADILSQDAAIELKIHQLHSAYFCRALDQWEQDMKSPRHAAVLKGIGADFENILQAWSCALENDDIPSLLKAVNGLGEYFVDTIMVSENKRVFKSAANVIEHRHGTYPEVPDMAVLLALLYAWQSFIFPTGLVWVVDDDVEELARKCLALLESPVLVNTDTRRETALIHYKLGALPIEECQVHLDLSLQLYRELEDSVGIGDVLYIMAKKANGQGNVEQFWQYIAECLPLMRKTGDPARLGYALFLVAGNYRYHQLDTDKALSSYLEAYAIFKQGGILLGMVEIQKNIAFLKWFLGEYDTALEYLADARVIALQSGNHYVATTFLSSSGLCQSWAGRFDLATAIIQEAIESDFLINKELPTLILAEIFIHIGRYQSARRLICELASKDLLSNTNEFWFHRINTWLALVEGDYDKALGEGQRCLKAGELYIITKKEWGAWARVLLGLVYFGLERNDEAKFVLFESLQFCTQIQAFIPLMHALPVIPVVLAASEDEVLQERAVELYALAMTRPFVANSKLFENIAEKPLKLATSQLPKEVILKAQSRGQALDWWETAVGLLEELRELGWDRPSV